MFVKQFGWLLCAAILVFIFVAIFFSDVGKSAGPAKQTVCPLGQFCLWQTADNAAASSGQTINFEVELRNNLNNTLKGLVLRYSVPRQTIVRSASAGHKRNINDVLWQVPVIHPGDSRKFRVKVEVLSFAPKKVANTAVVYYGGESWLKSRLKYRIVRASS